MSLTLYLGEPVFDTSFFSFKSFFLAHQLNAGWYHEVRSWQLPFPYSILVLVIDVLRPHIQFKFSTGCL